MDLITGVPTNKNKEVSFSYFVLPFKYHKMDYIQKSDLNSNLYYTKIDISTKSDKKELLDSDTKIEVSTESDTKIEETKPDFSIPWKSIREYFIKETADAILDRSEFYELDFQKDKEYTLNVSGKKIQTLLHAKVFLMEKPEVLNPKSKKDLLNDPTENTNPLKTGFFILEMYFKDDVTLNDLKTINELFRYYKKPYDVHTDTYTLRRDLELALEIPTPDWTTNKTEPSKKKEPNDYNYTNLFKYFLDIPLKNQEGFYYTLIQKKDSKDKESSDYDIYPDNRCFVYSAAIIQEESFFSNRPEYKKDWIEYLNVDKPDDLYPYQNTNFLETWVTNKTYRRWKESIYGYTAHSAVMICEKSTASPLSFIFRGVYFFQTLILLYNRCTILRFSQRLSEISEREDDDNWTENFSKLRKQFTMFNNIYRFPYISNQQQGIEMFAIAKDNMDMEELYEEIQAQLHSSSDFSNASDALTLNQTAYNMAKWGLPISLFSAAFGMFGMKEKLWKFFTSVDDPSQIVERIFFYTIMVLTITGSLLIIKYLKKR